MNVRRNVGFGLKMRGMARAELDRKVDEALATVRLTTQADKLPGQLSGGQQQRVAIARAIVIEPPLVLMDEPLSNLDAKLRLEMRQEIRRIHLALGSTTIYVTHDQEEALSLADRIVVLRDGAIRQVGTPSELYAAPAHLDVAEFMGFRNRLAGTISTEASGLVRIDIGGASLVGKPSGPIVGSTGVAAIRPDDLMPVSGEIGVPATVEAIEYRGREYHGIARSASGVELHFASHEAFAPGASLRLGAEPDTILVFTGESL